MIYPITYVKSAQFTTQMVVITGSWFALVDPPRRAAGRLVQISARIVQVSSLPQGARADELGPVTREPDFGALRLELSRLRHAKSWTYEVLADRSGVSRRTLISVETGMSHGSLDTWYRIAAALEVELADLMRAL